MLRGPIGRWASAKYDRQIALTGDLDVNLFSWTPSAVVRGLKIGGPDWARQQDTVDVDEIHASVRLRKLLAGQIEMPLLSFTRPKVVLIASQDGRKSWDLNPNKPDAGEGMKLPVIQQLVITDGQLSFDEQRRKMTLQAAVNAREAANGNAGFPAGGARHGQRIAPDAEDRGRPLHQHPSQPPLSVRGQCQRGGIVPDGQGRDHPPVSTWGGSTPP